MSVLGDSVPKSELSDLCRLCALPADPGVQIYSEAGADACLAEKIAKCLPVVIGEEDDLPKLVCQECQHKLEECRLFFEQIYNATVSLLSKLREVEDLYLEISLEDHLTQYVRNFPDLDHNDPLVYAEAEYTSDSRLKSKKHLNGSDEDIRTIEANDILEAKCEADSSNDQLMEIKEDFTDSVEVTKQEHVEVKSEPVEGEAYDEKANFKQEAKSFLDRLLDEYEEGSGRRSSRRNRGKPAKLYFEYSAENVVPKAKDGTKKRKSSADPTSVSSKAPKKPRKMPTPADPTKAKSLKNARGMACPPVKICSVCSHKSNSLLENIAHWNADHPGQEIIYKCDWDQCDFKSSSIVDTKKHRRQHMIDCKQLVKCGVCSKYYPFTYLHTKHMPLHQETENFKCEQCGKKFRTEENLKRHSRRIHAPEDQKYTHCCDLCGRRFTQKANLEAHMRVHSGIKPFPCAHCSKKFSQKGNLDEHMRVHTGEKPFVCDSCGSSFARKGELLLHIRCAHTMERPFQCSYCPKNFNRRDLLRKHERIHTNVRPYECEFCGKTFTARDKMIIHRRLHTGERPYVCNFCGRGFCESGNLKKHLKVHGNEIPTVIRKNNKGDVKELEGKQVSTSSPSRAKSYQSSSLSDQDPDQLEVKEEDDQNAVPSAVPVMEEDMSDK